MPRPQLHIYIVGNGNGNGNCSCGSHKAKKSNHKGKAPVAADSLVKFVKIALKCSSRSGKGNHIRNLFARAWPTWRMSDAARRSTTLVSELSNFPSLFFCFLGKFLPDFWGVGGKSLSTTQTASENFQFPMQNSRSAP